MTLLTTIFLMTIAQVLGCFLLNDNGGLTKNNKSLFAGMAASIISAYFAVSHFGAPSGLFVYLGFLSTLGMLFALLGFSRKSS